MVPRLTEQAGGPIGRGDHHHRPRAPSCGRGRAHHVAICRETMRTAEISAAGQTVYTAHSPWSERCLHRTGLKSDFASRGEPYRPTRMNSDGRSAILAPSLSRSLAPGVTTGPVATGRLTVRSLRLKRSQISIKPLRRNLRTTHAARIRRISAVRERLGPAESHALRTWPGRRTHCLAGLRVHMHMKHWDVLWIDV